MAKKSQWKAQIRAEVAAALHGSRPTNSPESATAEAGSRDGGRILNHESGVAKKTNGPADHPVTGQATETHNRQDVGLIRKDLVRIASVTAVLLILLTAITTADRRTNFLSVLYDKASRSVSQLGDGRSPPPTADETSPAANSPTETDQSAPAAAE